MVGCDGEDGEYSDEDLRVEPEVPFSLGETVYLKSGSPPLRVVAFDPKTRMVSVRWRWGNGPLDAHQHLAVCLRRERTESQLEWEASNPEPKGSIAMIECDDDDERESDEPDDYAESEVYSLGEIVYLKSGSPPWLIVAIDPDPKTRTKPRTPLQGISVRWWRNGKLEAHSTLSCCLTRDDPAKEQG